VAGGGAGAAAGCAGGGFLGTQSADDDYKNITDAFLQGLKETGYVEGQNVAVEYRWAENRFDRLPALAADLVRRRVAVIVAYGAIAAVAAKAATTTVPIVFATGGDLVALGLVASLNRPGANVTGSAILTAELAPKQLQLLRELMPNAARFGVLADPASLRAGESIRERLSSPDRPETLAGAPRQGEGTSSSRVSSCSRYGTPR
jgi:putative ABC transport system substrate-binding protein